MIVFKVYVVNLCIIEICDFVGLLGESFCVYGLFVDLVSLVWFVFMFFGI